MEFKLYNDINEFMERTQEYLEQDEAINNLMLGICMALKRGVKVGEGEPLLTTIEEDGKLLIAATMTSPKPLLLYGKECDDSVIDFLIQNLLERGITFNTSVAEATLAMRFADSWSAKTRISNKKGMNMRVYKLEKVNPVPMSGGSLRVADMSEIDLMADWVMNFALEAQTADMTIEEAREMAEARISSGSIHLWEVNSKPVSMAASSRKTNNGIVIALVYTPAEHKRKGYATACVAALSQKLLDEGNKFCALFTDLANPTSNSIYMKIGYEPLCDFDEYKFE